MKLLKSVVALLAGILSFVALSAGTDFVLKQLNIFPSAPQGMFANWMLILALVYKCIYAIAASYLTASLAPKKRMRHVTILGYIGVTVYTVDAITNWDKPDQWYIIALAITSLPCVWLGGRIRKTLRRAKRQ